MGFTSEELKYSLDEINSNITRYRDNTESRLKALERELVMWQAPTPSSRISAAAIRRKLRRSAASSAAATIRCRRSRLEPSGSATIPRQATWRRQSTLARSSRASRTSVPSDNRQGQDDR